MKMEWSFPKVRNKLKLKESWVQLKLLISIKWKVKKVRNADDDDDYNKYLCRNGLHFSQWGDKYLCSVIVC